ncbi:MAG: prolyl oligopeptidase family serine peptidase [Candidatus Levybacteria bacterium]|nr:prolyl oligopeptidase family serine peptidase [Candidatus Levybacteria bacterium]
MAKAGFITLAPDFLGYGQSDKPSQLSIEERFQTYTTALQLLSSLSTLNTALEKENQVTVRGNTSVGIWGHSNGGQIALSVLEISGRSYPTVLWAPVSKMFPYSILYYTDEFDDHGKLLRKVLAEFEKEYDVEKYSPTNYFDWIIAPIQLHQGVLDESVPMIWSDQLAEILKKKGKDVEYFTYPQENHNFTNGTWPLALSRSIAFYTTQFAK